MYAICHNQQGQQINVAPTQTIFSGGEVQITWPVANLRGAHLIQVITHITNSDDIMALLLGVDAIRRATFHQPDVELVIPYFPYARQDRVCSEGQSLSLSVMAGLINALKMTRVIICDPHSEVTCALIDNLHVISQADLARRHKKFCRKLCHRDTVIIAPDAGASKKAQAVASACEKGTPVIQALKQRHPQTGAITETVLLGDVQNKHCVMVDDICDGGRTFIELAKVLKAKGAKSVSLFVTHGIFSRGLAAFTGLIDHVYTTNSFSTNVPTCPSTVTLDVHPLSLL